MDSPTRDQLKPATAASAFISGLREPSPCAAVTMLSVVLLALMLPAVFVTPDFVRENGHQFLPRVPEDSDVFVSIRALELREFRENHPIVVITGVSTVRDALMVDALEASLMDQGYDHVEIFKLTTSKQNFLESLAMLDNAPRNARGVALIGVQPGGFSLDEKRIRDSLSNGRYAFRSPAFDEELSRIGIGPHPVTGNYFVDNIRFFLARRTVILRNLWRGSAPEYLDVWRLGHQPQNKLEWHRIGERVNAIFNRYQDNHKFADVILERLLRHLEHNTRLQPVLLDAPVNPQFLMDFEQSDLYSYHVERMRSIARSHGIGYINLNSELSLAPTQFYDWGHLNDLDAVQEASHAAAKTVALALDGQSP